MTYVGGVQRIHAYTVYDLVIAIAHLSEVDEAYLEDVTRSL